MTTRYTDTAASDPTRARPFTRRPSPAPGPVPVSYRVLATALNTVGRVAPELSARTLQALWFRPLHGKPGDRARAFWQGAHRRKVVHSGRDWVDLHFWGDPRAPLILGVHGWRGSGVQFRHLVRPLVDAGYQVCLFDLPAHGMYRTRFTHVFEFMRVLLEIQARVGPAAGVIAHSLGCQTVVQALAQGFQPGYLAFLAPGLNMEAMLDGFSDTLGLSPAVRARFKARLAAQSVGISRDWIGVEETLFQRLSHDFARRHLDRPGLLIADDRDEEVPWPDFEAVSDYWSGAQKRFSSGLGHYRILKDDKVLAEVTEYFSRLLTDTDAPNG